MVSGRQMDRKQRMTSDKWSVDDKQNASGKQPAAVTGTTAMETAATATTTTAAAITGQQLK